MNITYRFSNSSHQKKTLYLNIINKYACHNNCIFCKRPTKKEERKNNPLEKHANHELYLPREPTIQEVMNAIHHNIRDEDEEIAFIGLGEPLMNIDKTANIIKLIKKNYDIKTRVTTNGLIRHTIPDAAEVLKKAGLDKINISLNAINSEEYEVLCKSNVTNAFKYMNLFIKDCLKTKIETYVSFVVGLEIKPVRTKTEYEDYALSLGVAKDKIVFRKLMT